MKLVIDIDDTLLYSTYMNSNYEITGANEELIEIVNKMYNRGNEIILWTGRHWNHLTITETQLRGHGIKYNTLLMGKPTADYYIDDKAIKPEDFINEF